MNHSIIRTEKKKQNFSNVNDPSMLRDQTEDHSNNESLNMNENTQESKGSQVKLFRLFFSLACMCYHLNLSHKK